MGKRWHIHPHDSRRVTQLESAARIPAVVAQLLLCRGIDDPSAAQHFLAAKLTGLRDPEELPGVAEAADRIHAAILAKRKIAIYGDYDADGMTATALLLRCLRLLDADVRYYVPNRMDEGYGLNSDALRQLAERGVSLVVTVDCGIASVAEAETARELNLELIVTDHHEFAASLPAAATLVHPRLPGHNYPFGGLCGAGVAFKLAWALCQRASGAKKVSERLRAFLVEAVGLAAIGAVADVVPLVDENRLLVRNGLASLQNQPTPGLAALMRLTELDKKSCLSAEDIGFTIAPRLNAAGRLGQAQLGVELLETDSPARAAALAEYLQELNGNRESLERSIYLAADKQLKEHHDAEHDPAIVLAGRGWHAGVIGIVAGRLAEKYHRPTILIALDALGVKPGTGSARSAGSVNLHEALARCTEHLISHGGHAAAAGLKIEDSHVDAFREEFFEVVSRATTSADREADLHIDAEAPLSQLTLQTVGQIEQMAPFGQGNPRPLLCARQAELAEAPRRVGGGQRHLQVKLRQHNVVVKGFAFGQGDWADPLAELNRPFDIAFRPVIDEFRGKRSVALHLVDWRLA